MRKQHEFTATVVRNRNELIDATTAKIKVILIEGEVLETLRKEIKRRSEQTRGCLPSLRFLLLVRLST